MAIQSVIEIDVLDEKFKAFAALFEKYKKQVTDSNKDWKETNKQLAEAEKRQKALAKAIADSQINLKEVALTTKSIASNMASAALSAAKWMAYAAVGGGFGLGGLAASASNIRREATGYGISTGQLRAARTYGEPYLGGIESVLGNIQDLQTTLTEQYKVGILGGSLNKNAYQNLVPILQTLRNSKAASGGMVDVAMNTIPGLKDAFSKEQVQTVWNMSPDEFAKMISSLQTGANNFSKDERNYQAFREFWVELKKAGNVIEDTLVQRLAKITPSLIHLTEAINKAIKHFLDSGQLEAWLGKLEKGIEKFANYLADPKSMQDFDKFITAIGNVADGLVNLASLLGLLPKSEAEQNAENQKNAITPGGVNTPGTVIKSGISAIGGNSKSLVKNWYDYPLSTLTGVVNFLSTPMLTSDKVKSFFGGSNADFSHSDPQMMASMKALGITPISGYRSKQRAIEQGIWHEGSHHTLVDAQGYSHAMDIPKDQVKALLSKYSEQQLKDQFDIYRPYPNQKGEENHFERWSTRNQPQIYMYVDGVVTKAASMSGQQK